MGRDRREYLFEMMYWEIYLIQRGYRRRNVLQYQFQRLAAFGSWFAMSGADGLTPEKWQPCYFDRYLSNRGPQMTDEDRDDLMADIEAENKRLAEQRQRIESENSTH